MGSYRRPTLELDNSPSSLREISIKRIILDKIDFSHVSLPQELYDLLMLVSNYMLFTLHHQVMLSCGPLDASN